MDINKMIFCVSRAYLIGAMSRETANGLIDWLRIIERSA